MIKLNSSLKTSHKRFFFRSPPLLILVQALFYRILLEALDLKHILYMKIKITITPQAGTTSIYYKEVTTRLQKNKNRADNLRQIRIP
ncbi:hypothetical protein DSUL_50129 [Desulfovibrionales bacterium]